MQNKLGDKARLRHILDAITEIESYIIDSNLLEFTKNSMMRFACIKQMEIIGEASNHITEETKKIFSTVEWDQIIGMRNIFVHEYFGIDIDLAWQIIRNDIPNLKAKVIDILQKID